MANSDKKPVEIKRKYFARCSRCKELNYFVSGINVLQNTKHIVMSTAFVLREVAPHWFPLFAGGVSVQDHMKKALPGNLSPAPHHVHDHHPGSAKVVKGALF